MTIEDKLCLTQELIDLFLAGKINEEHIQRNNTKTRII